MPRTPDPAAQDALAVDRDLLDSLVQTSFIVMGMLSRLAARNDLSLTQVRLLGILRDRQPTMAALADHLGLEKSTISGLIDRAAERGLVERLAHPDDGRKSEIALTPRGRQLAAEAADDMALEAAVLVESLSPADRTSLRQLLQQICAASPGPATRRRARANR